MGKRKITPLNTGLAMMIFIILMYIAINVPAYFGDFQIFFFIFPFLFVVTFFRAMNKT